MIRFCRHHVLSVPDENPFACVVPFITFTYVRTVVLAAELLSYITVTNCKDSTKSIWDHTALLIP